MLLSVQNQRKKNRLIDAQHKMTVQQSLELAEYLLKERATYFAVRSSAWNNYPIFYETIDNQLNGFATYLTKQYHLNQTDIQICIATLYKIPAKEIAQVINRPYSSIGKLKSMTAGKLGSTSKNLRKDLLKLLTK